VFRLDAFVVRRNLYGPSIIRSGHLEKCCRGHTADGKFLRTIQKLAAVDPAMRVSVEQVQELLREIRCFLSFHIYAPLEYELSPLH
jgi:hypothetical protein